MNLRSGTSTKVTLSAKKPHHNVKYPNSFSPLFQLSTTKYMSLNDSTNNRAVPTSQSKTSQTKISPQKSRATNQKMSRHTWARLRTRQATISHVQFIKLSKPIKTSQKTKNKEMPNSNIGKYRSSSKRGSWSQEWAVWAIPIVINQKHKLRANRAVK
jgi:hypothetical protein